MAIRQLGQGGPIYDYQGSQSLSAPHSSISKIKVLTANVNVGAHTATVPLITTVAFTAGSFSARAILLCAQLTAALGTNGGYCSGRVSAADEVSLTTIASDTLNPAAQDVDFVILEP